VAAPDIVDTRQEAADLDPPPLIVRDALASYLEELGLGSGELTAERIGEGHSNITFLVRLGDRRVVLRRPPRPPIPPSAHDVLREARVLAAVQDTAVRVPEVLAVCDDESVLGVPF
jgi:aminoglycoside phosphotransferase (APT) family kinase protein